MIGTPLVSTLEVVSLKFGRILTEVTKDLYKTDMTLEFSVSLHKLLCGGQHRNMCCGS